MLSKCFAALIAIAAYAPAALADSPADRGNKAQVRAAVEKALPLLTVGALVGS